jgi:hypothetical protein
MLLPGLLLLLLLLLFYQVPDYSSSQAEPDLLVSTCGSHRLTGLLTERALLMKGRAAGLTVWPSRNGQSVGLLLEVHGYLAMSWL